VKVATGRLERKCRTCGTWATFTKGELADECPKCGKPYGPLELGMDVTPKTKGTR